MLELFSTRFLSMQKICINRNFALLWLGQTISQVGDYIFTTTLLLWITTSIGHGQSWTPLAVSGIIVMSTIPSILIRPLAGVFVDRWDKCRTMLVMDGIRAVLVTFLLLGTVFAFRSAVPGEEFAIPWLLGVIYAVVFLASVCSQFFLPARFVLIGDIIDAADRARAFGQSEATRSLAFICGPVLAAQLFFLVGLEWALIIDILSFMVSFLTVLAIHPTSAKESIPRPANGRFFQEFSLGVRFVVFNSILLTMTIAVCVVVLGSGSQDSLVIFFLTQNLHASTALYGLLSSVFAVGAVVGASIVGSLARRLGAVKIFCSSLLAYGILSIIFARLTSILPAFVFFFLLGVSTTTCTVISAPLTLQVTPRDFVGRVTSVSNAIIQLAWTISILVAGYLASTVLHNFHATVAGVVFGPIDTILLAAGVITTAGGFYALAGLRNKNDSEKTE